MLRVARAELCTMAHVRPVTMKIVGSEDMTLRAMTKKVWRAVMRPDTGRFQCCCVLGLTPDIGNMQTLGPNLLSLD